MSYVRLTSSARSSCAHSVPANIGGNCNTSRLALVCSTQTCTHQHTSERWMLNFLQSKDPVLAHMLRAHSPTHSAHAQRHLSGRLKRDNTHTETTARHMHWRRHLRIPMHGTTVKPVAPFHAFTQAGCVHFDGCCVAAGCRRPRLVKTVQLSGL